MNLEQIKKDIIDLLYDNGFTVLNHNDEEDNIIEMDSLQFISFLVEVEEKFKIVIPDEYLIENEKLTVNNISDFIVNYSNVTNNISL